MKPTGIGEGVTGESFLPSGGFRLGVNYWASHAATEMWRRWEPSVIRRDFSALRDHGLELVRCFPLWPDFQPIQLLRLAHAVPGGAPADLRMNERPLPDTFAGQCGMDETLLGRFREFCDLAAEYGLKLIVPLLTGHMTSRLFVPPALEGLDLYTHPLALKYEVKFIRCFVETLKDHPAIVAWESGNETNFLSGASEAAAAWTWTALIHGTIRAADPSRPIIGVSVKGLDETPDDRWLIRDQAELGDVMAGHPYCLWNPVFRREPFRAFRNLHQAALEVRMLADIGQKPAFIEETGTWRPMTGSGRELADAARNILWNLYQEDGRGLLWWCAFDQTHIDAAPYDWPSMGLEHGVFTAGHQPHPLAGVLAGFRRFLDALPFRRLPARRSDAVCLVNDWNAAFGAYLLARQAKINLRFAHAAGQPLPDADVYFLPSAARRGGLSTRKWHDLLARVRAGATLYLSLNDTILDSLDEATGCRVLDREEPGGAVTLRLDGIDIVLPRPVRYRMESVDAEILTAEADGNPVFFRHRFGKGTVHTLAFPLETVVAEHTGLLERGGHVLYRNVLPVERVLRCDDPLVTLTEHFFTPDTAAAILVNNRPEPVTIPAPCISGWTVEAVHADETRSAYADGAATLPANAGLLLMLRRCY